MRNTFDIIDIELISYVSEANEEKANSLLLDMKLIKNTDIPCINLGLKNQQYVIICFDSEVCIIFNAFSLG